MKKTVRPHLDQLGIDPLETKKNAAEALAVHFRGRVMTVVDAGTDDNVSSPAEGVNTVEPNIFQITPEIRAQMMPIEAEIEQVVTEKMYYSEAEFLERTEDQILNVFGQIYFRGRLDQLNVRDENRFSPEAMAAYEAWRDYFLATLHAANAQKFRDTITEVKRSIREEVETKKINLYSRKERNQLFTTRLEEHYAAVGFTRPELKKLVEFSALEDLDDLPIHKIKVVKQVTDLLGRYMKGERGTFVSLAVGITIPALMTGIAPKFLSDAFVSDKINISKLGIFAALAAGATGLGAWVDKLFSQAVITNNKKKGGYDETIADHFGNLSANDIQTLGNDTIKQRIIWAKNSYNSMIGGLVKGILPNLVTLATSVVVLLKMSPILAAATAGVTGLQLVTDRWFRDRFDFWGKQRKADQTIEESNIMLEKLLAGHMEMRLYGRDAEAKELVQTILAKSNEAQEEKGMFQMWQNTMYDVFSVANTLGAGLATLVAGGGAAQYIAALTYSNQMNGSVRSLLRRKNQFLEDLRDMMQLELTINTQQNLDEKIVQTDEVSIETLPHTDLQVQDLNFSIEKKKILKNINLSIPAGSIVTLNGISGSGKSTLLKLLSGYYAPSSGTVSLGGVDMKSLRKKGAGNLYELFSYVPQFPYIEETSVRENLLFGLGQTEATGKKKLEKGTITDEHLRTVLQAVNLDNRFSDLDEVLKPGRGDVGTLSGGEASRLGLARAMLRAQVQGSKIIFLDEPTASVDEPTTKTIAELINAAKQTMPDTTFIIISHDQGFLDQIKPDQVVQLDKGRIVS